MKTYYILMTDAWSGGGIIGLPFDRHLDKETAEARAAAYREANTDPYIFIDIEEEP